MTGYFVLGQNPAGGGPNAGLHRAGLRKLDWLVVLDWFPTETRDLLEGRPGRPAALGDQDRGLLHPGRVEHREGGHADQHPAPAPVAQQGARPAGRLPVRRLVRLQPGQAAAPALRRLDRPQGPAAPEPHLGLRPRRAPAAARRLDQPDRGGAGRREGPAGDQRPPARRGRPAHRASPAARGLLRAEGRRHDGLRLLDLQRRLPRAGPQPGRTSARSTRATRSSRSGATPGRTTAGSCTTAPRPTPRAGRGPSGRS